MRNLSRFCVIAAFGGIALVSSARAAGQDAAAQGTSLGTDTAIPVFTRFIRTSMSGTMSSSTVSRLDSTTGEIGTGNNVVQGERLYDSNEVATPMRGVVVVEAPLSALKFTSEKGNYLARARVTATALDGSGRAVWSGQKEVTIRGPERKLEARRQGSLYFVRGVTLPGGAEYSVEAKVEDLEAGTTGTIRTPFKPSASAPGLNASDAMFVRKFDGAVDRFEADQVFSFEGNAFSPVLDPVFPAGRAFGMQLFFLIYPDINGAQPDMSLQLMSDGRVAAQGSLPFKNKLREAAYEGRATNFAATERAHEFPYLADMNFNMLPAGDYEAVVTIRQGNRTITRGVPFRVVGNPPPAAQPAN